MKIKTGISIIMTLLMIASTFTVVDADPGECWLIEVSKKVWNGNDWVDEVDIIFGETETVRFNVTITYIKTCENGKNASNIQVIDTLPPCLTYANDANYEESYIEDNLVYWNLTEDHGIILENDTSVSIEFNATVVDIGDNENYAEVTAHETGCNRDLYGNDNAWVNVTIPPVPDIDITKEVKDPITDEWVDEIVVTKNLFELEKEAFFKLNVTNTGNVLLKNVTVIDTLPEGLVYEDATIPPDYIVGNLIYWNFSTLDSDAAIFIEFSAKTTECGEYVNYVYVEGEFEEQTVDAYDTAKVSVSGIKLVKEASYDGQNWEKHLPGVVKGLDIYFKITIEFVGDGNPGHFIDCGYVADYLHEGCLEYLETTSVIKNDVVEIEPYIIPDHGDILETCFGEINITEVLEDEGCQLEGVLIVWDLNVDPDFYLEDGDILEIVFVANVTHYCEECIVNNFAAALMWNCKPCINYFDWDNATVDCSQPELPFEKKVWDGEDWADEAEAFVDDKMKFKLEVTYYGNDDITDLRFKDELPSKILEFAEVDSSSKNFSVEVSDDKSTVWFNMSEDTVTDSEVVTIVFNVAVVGVTAYTVNKAWLTGEQIAEYYDEVDITTIGNEKPCPPIISGPDEGKVGIEYTYDIIVSDPDKDDVFLFVDWGDDTGEWTGPYLSDTTVKLDHTWDSAGEFIVKAKAKDPRDEESDWGNEITVTIEEEPTPDLKVCIKRGLSRGVIVTLTNKLETVDINDIVWDLEVSKRFLGRILYDNTGTTETLEGGNSVEIGGLTKFGFGLISVKVNVSATGIDSIIKTAKGFILFRFVWIM